MEDEYFLIIEDDFYITNHNDFINFVKDFNNLKKNNNWDIFLFTPVHTKRFLRKKFFKNFYSTVNSQTTTGYIIRNSFLPILIDNFKEGLRLFIEENKNEYTIDQYWKKLQLHYRFIYHFKKFVIQYPDYSDIEKKNVNYFRFRT